MKDKTYVVISIIAVTVLGILGIWDAYQLDYIKQENYRLEQQVKESSITICAKDLRIDMLSADLAIATRTARINQTSATIWQIKYLELLEQEIDLIEKIEKEGYNVTTETTSPSVTKKPLPTRGGQACSAVGFNKDSIRSAIIGAGCSPATARLVIAIAGVESGFGKKCYRKFNAWGYGGKSFASFEQGGVVVAQGIEKNYPNFYTNGEAFAKKYNLGKSPTAQLTSIEEQRWRQWLSNVRSFLR